MEQSFNTGVRVVAAATFAAVVAVTAWHTARQPRTEPAIASAPIAEPTAGVEAKDTSAQETAAAAPQAPVVTESEIPASAPTPAPVTETEPAPSVADALPAPSESAPVEAASTPEPTPHTAEERERSATAVTSGPKYANVVPDKSPRAKSEPHPRSAPAARKPTSDQTVMHVRRLQTQLMVGALSCGRPRMQHNYNNFVRKFDRALKVNGQQLKSYFASRYGARGIAEMDSYLTKLSNELSLVSMRNHEFCERTDGLFDTVLQLPANEIETFADRYMLQAVASRGF